MLKNIFWVFFISMLPVVELRGSIVVGAGLYIPWWINYAVSVIGNFLPVPFILLFIRQLFKWMKGIKYLDKIANKLEEKAHKKSADVLKYASLGMFLFVAIPLPGTGAWTGSLIASLLDMRLKYALPSIFAGVLTAGFLVTGATYGFLGFLDFIL